MSDKHLTERSDIVKKLLPGDIAMTYIFWQLNAVN